MPKSFIVAFFSLVLTSSTLIPSVIRLMDNEYTIVINDFSDNENKDSQDKELEDVGNEEEKIFFSSFDFTNHAFAYNNQVTSNFYILGTSNSSLKIQLPPPEHTT
ncbi:MAG: hypothetical protein WBM53_07920 [Maribacter sp.]